MNITTMTLPPASVVLCVHANEVKGQTKFLRMLNIGTHQHVYILIANMMMLALRSKQCFAYSLLQLQAAATNAMTLWQYSPFNKGS